MMFAAAGVPGTAELPESCFAANTGRNGLFGDVLRLICLATSFVLLVGKDRKDGSFEPCFGGVVERLGVDVMLNCARVGDCGEAGMAFVRPGPPNDRLGIGAVCGAKSESRRGVGDWGPEISELVDVSDAVR